MCKVVPCFIIPFSFSKSSIAGWKFRQVAVDRQLLPVGKPKLDKRLPGFAEDIFLLGNTVKAPFCQILQSPINGALAAAVFAIDQQVGAADVERKLITEKTIVCNFDAIDAHRAIYGDRFRNRLRQDV